MTNIVKVKFENNEYPGTYSERAYLYFSSIVLKEGDVICAPTKYGEQKAIVSEVNVEKKEIEYIRKYMKTITTKINK